MFVRPTRQATTRSPHEAGQVLVHRNELNEQHRPGALVLFPQSFKESKEEKATTRWIPKLIRQLTLSGDGSDASAVMADGLLLYTGAYIRRNQLDVLGVIPTALLCKDVLFVTNHVDVSPARGHASSMTGWPVQAAPAPAVLAAAIAATTPASAPTSQPRRRRRARLTRPKRQTPAPQPSDDGDHGAPRRGDVPNMLKSVPPSKPRLNLILRRTSVIA
jgi:hypothetical protein